MKKNWMLLVVVAVGLFACNSEVKVETRLDSLGNKIDSGARNLKDSAKEKWKDLKEGVKDLKDSADKKLSL